MLFSKDWDQGRCLLVLIFKFVLMVLASFLRSKIHQRHPGFKRISKIMFADMFSHEENANESTSKKKATKLFSKAIFGWLFWLST